MDVTAVRTFAAVVDAGQFQEAATDLSVTRVDGSVPDGGDGRVGVEWVPGWTHPPQPPEPARTTGGRAPS
jgi:hypothetical protein